MKLKQFRFDECGDLTVDVFADDAMINAEPFTVSGLPGAYVIVDINPDANRWLVAVGWIDADGNPEEYARYFSCREAALVEAKSLPVELPLISLRNIGYGKVMTCEYQVWSDAPAYGGMYTGQVGSICRCGKPAKEVETFVTTRRGQPTGKRKKVWLCEAHAKIVADNVGFVKAEKA